VEIIHGTYGIVTRIIQNVPEVVRPGRISLSQRLAIYHYDIALQPLDEFEPSQDDHYILGFKGYQGEQLVELLIKEHKIKFSTLIHPTAIISDNVQMGEGTIVNAGAVVAPNAKLGKHVFVNRGATIGHDTVVGDFAIINPGANIAGHAVIGYGVMVGMGANVIQDISIGAKSVIGAGAVVIKDVDRESLMVGVPAVNKKK
jgi:sugar O-acyltransferase (sialic acid O-acetyltransferase NeuD family)